MASSNNGHSTEGGDRNIGAKDSRLRTRKSSPIRWTVGLVVRLCIWYTLLTPFFRCPSRLSDLTESSPRVCKPYLYARSYVEPHVLPYYDAYAAPYVETIRPYARVMNERVYVPASNIAKQSYHRFGAPALNQVQAYGQRQWTTKAVPHIQYAKAKSHNWYEGHIGAHVNKVTSAVSPYYQSAHKVLRTTLDSYIIPFCAKYQPFIGKTYTSGQEVLRTTVMPYTQSAWSSTIYFVNSSLWPKIFSLYSETVEPQLVKIGQRLASYREGKRLRQVIDDAESSFSESFTSSSSSQVDSKKSESLTTSSIVETTLTPTLSPTELAAQTREKLSSDLDTWEQRFAAAAQQGTAGFEARLKETVTSYLAAGVKTDGEKLISALETAVDVQTSAIKHRIGILTKSLPFEEAPQEEATAVEELLKEVRNAALSLRDRAHALREWHNSFEQELAHRVSTAINSTLAVLDDVHDLGIREIGMRWAWMDGVTYKDWEDFHALKAQFDDWKDDFRQVGLQHATIGEAKAIADDLLSNGMDIAAASAKELSRLRNVGNWKIAAREVSENFDNRSDPLPPLPKPSRIPEELKGPNDQVPSNTATEGSSDREPDILNLPDQKTPHRKAVQALLSELLAGKDPAYVEDLLNKLHAIYEAPHLEFDFPPVSTYSEETKPTLSSTQSSEPASTPIHPILEIVDEQLESAVNASFEDPYLYIDDDIIQEQVTSDTTSDGLAGSDEPALALSEDFQQGAESAGEVFESDEEIIDDFISLAPATSTLTSTTTKTISLEQVVSNDTATGKEPREDTATENEPREDL